MSFHTMVPSPKPESFHDTNFVVTGGTASCRYDTCDVANVDKIGIKTTPGVQRSPC